jgi:hypothetical protein
MGKMRNSPSARWSGSIGQHVECWCLSGAPSHLTRHRRDIEVAGYGTSQESTPLCCRGSPGAGAGTICITVWGLWRHRATKSPTHDVPMPCCETDPIDGESAFPRRSPDAQTIGPRQWFPGRLRRGRRRMVARTVGNSGRSLRSSHTVNHIVSPMVGPIGSPRTGGRTVWKRRGDDGSIVFHDQPPDGH